MDPDRYPMLTDKCFGNTYARRENASGGRDVWMFTGPDISMYFIRRHQVAVAIAIAIGADAHFYGPPAASSRVPTAYAYRTDHALRDYGPSDIRSIQPPWGMMGPSLNPPSGCPICPLFRFPSIMMPPLSTTRIIVSSNGEQYRVVEITGARSGASIRERIFSKLSIPDDRQSYFSVYQSEVGVFAIGGALTDSRLFEVCQQYGDASGSLKFFVSTAPDRPHETSNGYSEPYPYPVAPQYRPSVYNGQSAASGYRY
ncbi:hypothetical protein C8R46DRAFT_1188608 [Mycena filopes]|nr:hypothetical protein C8R46DRAFT_1188608 [Mycena filopes]